MTEAERAVDAIRRMLDKHVRAHGSPRTSDAITYRDLLAILHAAHYHLHKEHASS